MITRTQVIVVIAAAIAIATTFIILSANNNKQSENNTSNYFIFGNYTLTDNGLAIINNKTFFISPIFNPDKESNKTIQFHGVIFSNPTSTSINPSGQVSSLVVFPDGTNETLNIGPLPPITVLSKHLNPQVGVTRELHDNFRFLTSIES